MRRRSYVAGMATGGLSLIAGCIVGELGDASVELLSVDATEVTERDTLRMLLSVENSGDEDQDVQLIGEADFDDRIDEARRDVTVPPGEHEFNVKNRWSTGFFDFYTYDAQIEEDPDADSDGDDGYHDLYVTDLEQPSEESVIDGNAHVKVTVDNYGGEERTAMLETTVDVNETLYTKEESITVGAESTEDIDVFVSNEEPTGIFTWKSWAQIT